MENQISLDRLEINSLSVSNRKNFSIKIKEILFNPDKKDGIRCSLSIFADKVKIECDLYFIYERISDKNYSYLVFLKDSVEKFLNKDNRLQGLSKKIAFDFNSKLDFIFYDKSLTE